MKEVSEEGKHGPPAGDSATAPGQVSGTKQGPSLFHYGEIEETCALKL